MGYEIRAMSFGEILDAGFQLLRDHFVLLVGTASVLYVPTAILNGYLGRELQDPARGALAAAVAAGAGLLLLALVAAPIVQVAVTYAIGEVYVGRQRTIGSALRFGLSILLPLAGTAALVYLAILCVPTVAGGVLAGVTLWLGPALGMEALTFLGVGVAGLVAGAVLVYISLSFLIVWQVMVLERVFGVTAMRRSRALMRGHLMRGFGVMLVSALVILLLVGGVGFVLAFIPWLGSVGAGVAQAAGAAYGAAVGVALYFDLRCRKEAFEIEHLAQKVLAGAPTVQSQ